MFVLLTVTQDLLCCVDFVVSRAVKKDIFLYCCVLFYSLLQAAWDIILIILVVMKYFIRCLI